MYAVIETGGKQYRVEVGTELEVELLDVEPGQSITLERVLLVADGDEASDRPPVVDGAAVEAEVVRRDRGDKIISFKYRPKARRRVKKGHRQELTVLRIDDIGSAARARPKRGQGARPARSPSASASRRPPPARPPRTRPSPPSSQVGAAKARPTKAAKADHKAVDGRAKARRPSTKAKADGEAEGRPTAKPAAKATRRRPRRRRPPRRAEAQGAARQPKPPKASRTKKDE